MTNTPRTPTAGADGGAHVRIALERAQKLSDSRPDGGYTTGWSHEAFHVGDLSVLALALRG